jgi:hypothetical protein
LLLAAFGQPLLALANYAAHSALHSHILLIPFVSAYLLYIRRDQLPRRYVADLPLGMVLLAGGLGVLLFTYWLNFAGRALADNYYLVLLTLSFLCCLAAGGFFFFGRDWMGAAVFPVAYLIFMVPMPDAMEKTRSRVLRNTPRRRQQISFFTSAVRRFSGPVLFSNYRISRSK